MVKFTHQWFGSPRFLSNVCPPSVCLSALVLCRCGCQTLPIICTHRHPRYLPQPVVVNPSVGKRKLAPFVLMNFCEDSGNPALYLELTCSVESHPPKFVCRTRSPVLSPVCCILRTLRKNLHPCLRHAPWQVLKCHSTELTNVTVTPCCYCWPHTRQLSSLNQFYKHGRWLTEVLACIVFCPKK